VICKVQTMVVIRQSIQEDNVLHIKIINFKVTANASKYRSVKLWYSFTFVFSRGFDFSSIFKSMHFCRLFPCVLVHIFMRFSSYLEMRFRG